jgi:tRNA-dihydrouridine synthase B
MATHEKEKPVATQIFGSDPEIMAEVAGKISESGEVDIIDINMGCPAPKVVKNEDGSRLMLKPELIDEITAKVVEKSKVPVTIKIRIGWDLEHVNAVEIAKIAEKNGIAAIAVHGRTRDQFYTGKADLEIIKAVKENVGIPIIGNGDIVNVESAQHMLEYTKCDAIMIGRASNGNPWIFKDIISCLEKGEAFIKPTIDEIKSMILRHLQMLIEYKGEYTAVREMRKHIAWYIKGIENAASVRNKVNQIENCEELKRFVEMI